VSLVEKLDDVLKRCCLESTAAAGTCGSVETVYRRRSPQLTQEVNASVRASETREDDDEMSDSDSDSSSDDEDGDYDDEIDAESALTRTPSHQLLYRDFIEGLSKSNLHILEHLLNPTIYLYKTKTMPLDG
jgi:hypothetical protein